MTGVLPAMQHLTGSNCQEERLIIVVSRLYIEASLEVH